VLTAMVPTYLSARCYITKKIQHTKAGVEIRRSAKLSGCQFGLCHSDINCLHGLDMSSSGVWLDRNASLVSGSESGL
jgi:hypothetical protein